MTGLDSTGGLDHFLCEVILGKVIWKVSHSWSIRYDRKLSLGEWDNLT